MHIIIVNQLWMCSAGSQALVLIRHSAPAHTTAADCGCGRCAWKRAPCLELGKAVMAKQKNASPFLLLIWHPRHTVFNTTVCTTKELHQRIEPIHQLLYNWVSMLAMCIGTLLCMIVRHWHSYNLYLWLAHVLYMSYWRIPSELDVGMQNWNIYSNAYSVVHMCMYIVTCAYSHVWTCHVNTIIIYIELNMTCTACVHITSNSGWKLSPHGKLHASTAAHAHAMCFCLANHADLYGIINLQLLAQSWMYINYL